MTVHPFFYRDISCCEASLCYAKFRGQVFIFSSRAFQGISHQSAGALSPAQVKFEVTLFKLICSKISARKEQV